MLGIGLWQLQLNATAMAAAADLQEQTAPRGLHLLDGGLDETSPREPTRHLEPQVAAEEGDQRAGRKGRAREVERQDRAPRQRGLQLRGRATAEMGRPPRLGLGQRRAQAAPDAPAAQVSLAVLEHVRTAPIQPSMAAQGKAGAPFFTDDYSIYHCTEAASDHRTVNHGAGAYARRDWDGTWVPCNTMEGLWSGRRHFLDPCKGSSPRFLHLRVARDEFLHNHGHLPWRQTVEAALRCIFSPPGDYWRRMPHQHRRIPLTLCYR